MLKAFCDECNRNVSDVHFIMAGWTANVRDWEKFSDTWQGFLSRKPAINYFKTHEADTLNGEFGHMDRAQAEHKKLGLTRVICDYRDSLFGYITTVPHEYLRAKPKKLRKSVGSRIYDWAFICQVSTILEHALYAREKEKVDFVFDKCSELRTCISSYEEMIPKLPLAIGRLAGTIVPGNDEEICALQAADLLAGEHASYMRTGSKSIRYSEMERAKVPILVVPASPPQQMHALLRYAKEVFEREDLVREMLKVLKSRGITISDLRKIVEESEKNGL